MRRLRPLDAALLVILVPLWVLFLALYVNNLVQGRPVYNMPSTPLGVSAPETADGYPAVSWVWRESGWEATGVAVGDRLLRLGNADLRGVGPLGFVARAQAAADLDLRVPISFVRLGERGEASLGLRRVAFPWRTLPLTLGFAVTAVLVLLRVPGSHPARAFFLASMAYSFHWTAFYGGPRALTYAWVAVHFFSASVMLPLILRAVLIFPDESASIGARLPAWPWLFSVFGPILASAVFGVPLPPAIGLRAYHAVNVAFFTTLLVLATRNFYRAGPIVRRKVKWVVYGFYIGGVPTLFAAVVSMLDPSLWRLQEIAAIPAALSPLCIFIAIVRFNLFDIDRLIWSAIGNTTNLAARLQSLTRELDAAIVIDARTWTAAGDAAVDFASHEQTPIRGRRQTEDVYALPLAASALQVSRSPAASA